MAASFAFSHAELLAITAAHPLVPMTPEEVNVFAFIPAFRHPDVPLRSVSDIVDAYPLLPVAPVRRSVEQIVADYPLVVDSSETGQAQAIAPPPRKSLPRPVRVTTQSENKAPEQQSVPLPRFAPQLPPRTRPAQASSSNPYPASKSRPILSQIAGAQAKSARALTLLPRGQLGPTWTAGSKAPPR